MIGGRAALRVASTACDDSLVVPARKPRLASTSALAFWPWPPAAAPGTVKVPLAPSIRTVPRPPESSTTALALPLVRSASPTRRASSGRAAFQSPPAAGLTSTRPRPGFSSVITAAVSVVWAWAGRAGTRGAARNRSSSTLIARLITSRLLKAQQLVDLDRLAPPLHRHAAPVPDHRPVAQHGEHGAADQNAGAEVAIQPLHAGGHVDGVAQHRVLLLARGAEGAREGGPGVHRDPHREGPAALRLPPVVEPCERGVHPDRAAGGVPAVLGVVEGRPVDRHDRVADEVLHEAAVGQDHVHHRGEVLVHHLGDRLGGQALRDGGEP